MYMPKDIWALHIFSLEVTYYKASLPAPGSTFHGLCWCALCKRAASFSRSTRSAGLFSSCKDDSGLTYNTTPLGLSSPEACSPHRIDCGETAATMGKRSELHEIWGQKVPNRAPKQKRKPTFISFMFLTTSPTILSVMFCCSVPNRSERNYNIS